MFGAIGGFITFIIIAVIILFVLSTCIRVVPQAQALVVERLGAYLGTYSVGIHFLVPFIDRVAKKVNLKEQVEDFPPQPVITKDNVTMQDVYKRQLHGGALRCRHHRILWGGRPAFLPGRGLPRRHRPVDRPWKDCHHDHPGHQ